MDAETQFWYRSSRLPLGGWRSVPEPAIYPHSPPVALPGEQLIIFDIQGRLKRYEDSGSGCTDGAWHRPQQWEEFFALASMAKDELREVSHGADGVSWEYRDGAGIVYRIDGRIDEWTRAPVCGVGCLE